MDTQNTPVHFKLWHRDFWLLAIANLFLMTSTYMLIPALPPYLIQAGFSHLKWEVSWVPMASEYSCLAVSALIWFRNIGEIMYVSLRLWA